MGLAVPSSVALVAVLSNWPSRKAPGNRLSAQLELEKILLTQGALGGSDGSTHGRASGLDGHLGGQAGSDDTGGGHCDCCEEGRRCIGGVKMELG
jgi:hypothetical protein